MISPIDARSATVASLEAFFHPRAVAVIGASEGSVKPGGRSVFNLPHFGFRGGIYPVTPKGGQVHGYPAFSSISELPDDTDLAVVCLRADRVPTAIRELGDRGVRAAVVYAAGFGDDRALAADLAAAQSESGVRIVGPNTVGIRFVDTDGTGTLATFSADIEAGVQPGSIAVVAQSGGLGCYFGSAYLQQLGAGARYVLDTGAELDVDSAQMIDYVATDPAVTAIALILEGTSDGRRLVESVRRAVTSGTPVVFLKTGKSTAGAAQVASHTGSMVGSAALFDAALRDAGATVVADEGEFVDALRVYSTGHAPAGRNVGVVTASGGFGIIAADAAERFGLDLPEPTVAPTAKQQVLLAAANFGNPIDYQAHGSAGPDSQTAALEWMAKQPDVDAVVLWQAYITMREDAQHALEKTLLDLQGKVDVPLYGCGITTPEFESRLRELGMLWFSEPTRLFRALSVTAPRPEIRDPSTHSQPETNTNVVTGAAARALVSQIEHAQVREVTSAAQAQALTADWGKLVLKVEDPRFPHKTELGLVSGILDKNTAAAGYEVIAVNRAAVGADDVVVTAQRFVSGFELAFGAYQDPVFGPSIMVAMGGINLEVDKDLALALAPVTELKARELICSLRGAAVLFGARGKALADVDAAASSLAAFSRFVAESAGQWESIDVNPVIVQEKGHGVVAVDLVLVPATVN